ncbi:MotA/TolQ/ExbB proton channel family protein [Arenibaculum sp.]|jgi:biopolymer transport protein ExbB|uniref:MotA/TolQ/ExbB proton channel family protein n=1 Tax=Arenibaculum sp. TaxID=2865862 RepID=UPI002E12AC03|nr:MotA/TolQ/ExbB proton channel family protein [Arenibaculum sp.]
MDLEPTTTGGSLIGLLEAGGPIMYVLAALSVLATAIVLAKLLRFALRGSGPGWRTRVALEAWEAGRGEEALRLLEGDRSPAAPALARAAAGRLSGDTPESRLREEASRLAQRQLDGVASGLKALALVATLSPLLGLLGTVIGMIDAFRAMEAAGSRVDPSILSGGIWVALLTTAAGLVVAIPAAAAHGLLEAHADHAARGFEDALTRIFTRGPAAAQPRARLAAE